MLSVSPDLHYNEAHAALIGRRWSQGEARRLIELVQQGVGVVEVSEISLPEAMKGVRLDVVVTGEREAATRMRIGGWLLKLGARVMGCDIDVSSEPTDCDVIRYHPIGGGPVQTVLGRRLRG